MVKFIEFQGKHPVNATGVWYFFYSKNSVPKLRRKIRNLSADKPELLAFWNFLNIVGEGYIQVVDLGADSRYLGLNEWTVITNEKEHKLNLKSPLNYRLNYVVEDNKIQTLQQLSDIDASKIHYSNIDKLTKNIQLQSLILSISNSKVNGFYQIIDHDLGGINQKKFSPGKFSAEIILKNVIISKKLHYISIQIDYGNYRIIRRVYIGFSEKNSQSTEVTIEIDGQFNFFPAEDKIYFGGKDYDDIPLSPLKRQQESNYGPIPDVLKRKGYEQIPVIDRPTDNDITNVVKDIESINLSLSNIRNTYTRNPTFWNSISGENWDRLQKQAQDSVTYMLKATQEFEKRKKK